MSGAKPRDMVIVGLGNSTLDDISEQVADAQGGRNLKPDPRPERGSFYRSDHFEFAKQGVPALDIHGGIDYIGKPADLRPSDMDEYTANDYHKPSDEVKPDWDLSGQVQDTQLLFEVGLKVANGDVVPGVEARH